MILDSKTSLKVVSLFSGIGGLDLGLERAGHEIVDLCESWAPARAVLEARFPGVEIWDDVQTFHPTRAYDLLAAGFPCVDLSHAGGQRGIFGPQSGLVSHVFRVIDESRPQWVALENVTNLLRLGRGAGIRYLVEQFSRRGYTWAYRVVDSRASGVPQRRHRVLILASLSESPVARLLADEAGPSTPGAEENIPSGFYWTEGRRGVGLVAGAIPTLKGGSTVGAPSAPAIWVPDAKVGRRFVVPSTEDGEALQGFPRGWTLPAASTKGPDPRWKLIGNAVTVGVAEWLGSALARPPSSAPPNVAEGDKFDLDDRWPQAAWGTSSERWASGASMFPVRRQSALLTEAVNLQEARPLSHRATAGFISRIAESGISIPEALERDLEQHLSRTRIDLDWSASTATSRRMRRTGQRNTAPEVRLRHELTALGVRYRLQRRPEPELRWRADFLFSGARLVVDVRGCYWHACEIHSTWPKANAERWKAKLDGNRERDARMVTELSDRGWEVLTVWEHEDPAVAAIRIRDAVASRVSRKKTS